jgi:hypothetical protein
MTSAETPAPSGEDAMKPLMSETNLKQGSALPARKRGRTDCGFGFRPAYLDFETQTVYPSRYADGRLAPCHVLDGLPEAVIADRLPCGRIVSTKATLIAGFVRNGFFYTRSAAARAAAEWVDAQ